MSKITKELGDVLDSFQRIGDVAHEPWTRRDELRKSFTWNAARKLEREIGNLHAQLQAQIHLWREVGGKQREE